MSTYCVSFRIGEKTVNGKSYAERYNTLVYNVRRSDRGYWEETTSFFLVESDLTTQAFASKAFEGLSAAEDAVLVFDPYDMSAVFFGHLKYETVLRSFFPKLERR